MSLDIFSLNREENLRKSAPLAERMRPRSLEEFVGQAHILGEGKLLRRAIEADRLSSLILWGPPGTGKTTLAKIIANTTGNHFTQLNAVTSGVADVRRVVDEAKDRLGMYGQRSILFIDEVHRFNKAQQDALLPSVEEGLVIFIGATTMNPMIECTPALVSRSLVFRLESLGEEALELIIYGALADRERGLGDFNATLTDEALRHLLQKANGDARSVLNALELAVLTTKAADGIRMISQEIIEDSIQQKMLRYDANGDEHYNVISAYIKSIRGSDADAAIYWLARMLYAGEDPRYIARRLLVSASEDIGLANPDALSMALAASSAVEYLGMPEARIPLAEATIYLARSPKSNSAYMAINKALQAVEESPQSDVPKHLRDASYKGARRLGHGEGYIYPHTDPEKAKDQKYLPDGVGPFYSPSGNGEDQ